MFSLGLCNGMVSGEMFRIQIDYNYYNQFGFLENLNDLLPVLALMELDRSHSHTWGESSQRPQRMMEKGSDKVGGIPYSTSHILFHKFRFHDLENSWYHVTSYNTLQGRYNLNLFSRNYLQNCFIFPKG